MHCKTRQEIAQQYGISTKTLSRWLKDRKVEISPGLLTPEEQKRIHQALRGPDVSNFVPKSLNMSSHVWGLFTIFELTEMGCIPGLLC